MRNKLKKRIKLIKIIIFSFGFLVFFGLFMGINNNGRVKQNKTEEDTQEKISSIIPMEFNLDDEDYKIYSSMNDKVVYIEKSEDTLEGVEQRRVNNYRGQRISNGNYSEARENSEQTNAYELDQTYIPEVFSDNEGQAYYSDSRGSMYESPSEYGSDSITATLQRMNESRMITSQTRQSNQHIELGRNSGLFVGAGNDKQVATDVRGVGDVLQSMSGQLSGLNNSFNGQGLNQQADAYTQQNNQSEKKAFLQEQSTQATSFDLADEGKFYSDNEDLLVIAGSVIPIVMVTGINSDLPGMISARVTEDVYDSLYGTHIIIPKGSMVIGSYDSSLSWGQKRLLVAWARLSRPDGFTVRLEGMQGIDNQGASGIQGNVKTYMGASIASAILTSAFSLGVNYSAYYVGQVDDTGILSDSTQEAGSGARNSFKSITQKLLNRQPTVKIKPGTKSFIFVNKDMKLPSFTRK